jgi:hypothetical protein
VLSCTRVHAGCFFPEVNVEPQKLECQDFAAVLIKLDRLHQGGWEKRGQWDLAQACNHLAYFIEGSLDGHPYKVPWLLKVLLGRFVLRRILTQRKMKPGVPTPHKPLPPPGEDQAAAVARLKQALARLQAHQGELHASPFFGHLTPEQWRELHLIHCNHHLGFLTQRSGS